MREPSAADADRTGERLSVVIVEDSAPVRRRLRALLAENEGVRVVGEATDGTEGLELLSALEPDAVVLDLGLPEMNGFELLRRVRESGRQERPTLFVLTNHADRVSRRRALRSGADYFFDKADELDALLAALDELVESASDRRRNS